ncbi:Protein ARV1 [Strongyloides ratti]|uniref:Protein ARV n=1 Tax=Strongyloides ratti TaxID=34506 RepID=A0A090LHG9_STRRB|nr:Protein ARV1 [Strongyloides ratti]CEF66955.1 Protein ARV1 [Strongyloides ratti]
MDIDIRKKICINCGRNADNLYHQYEKNIIRLSICKYCNRYVDKYIEDDYPLICIDIFLQNIKAYRHVLINEDVTSKLTVVMVLLMNETFVKWYKLIKINENDNNDIHYTAVMFYTTTVQIILGYFIYCLILKFMYFIITKEKIQIISYNKEFTNCVLGSYGYAYKTLVIIWDIEEHWLTIFLYSLIIILSHIQIQRTLNPSLSKYIITFCVIISLIFKESIEYYIS